MKILIINGSARKGNTFACVSAFAKVAAAANEVEVLEADKLNISGCKGCEACGCTKGCVAGDDTNPVVDRIVAADLVVFASPVYWWGVTAQLKTVIDKCYCRGALLKDKKIGLIVCGGAETDDEEYVLIRRQFELISEYLSWDMQFFRSYYACGKDDVAGRPEVLAELEALGAVYR